MYANNICDFDRPMLAVITDVILPPSMGETTQTPTHFVGFGRRCDVHHWRAGRHRRRCPDKMPMWLLNQAELPMILSSTCVGGPRYFFLGGGELPHMFIVWGQIALVCIFR